MEYKGYKLRHEFKYYINTFVYYELRERFRQILQADANMKDEEGYLISSIYFDDFNHSAVEDKINGTPYREKYRIRLYNHDDTLIRIECKVKFNEFISKQWACISREEYDRIINGDYEFLISRPEEVCRRLYLEYRTKMMRPVTVVEYMREAYVHPLGNVRVTFDKNLSASIGASDIFDAGYETMQVPMDNMMIMEVKYDDYIPDYIKKTFPTDHMIKSSISKYIMCRDINRKVRIV